jgi:hypothetical protein
MRRNCTFWIDVTGGAPRPDSPNVQQPLGYTKRFRRQALLSFQWELLVQGEIQHEDVDARFA